jgi:type I restriction enzyme S subunit
MPRSRLRRQRRERGEVHRGTGSLQRFKPSYPAYKDSGVEWLGQIPAHWEVRKVKRLCLVRRGASPRPIDDPIYFDDDGEYAWVRIADVTASERYLTATTERLSSLGKSRSVALEPGELFVSIAATVGKPIITRIKCCIHDGFVYFVGLREDREYLYYLFSCGEPYKGLGKLGTQLNLNTDTIGDIYLPLPKREEQQAIVRVLDRETARIDALMARKARLIELLQEQRTALITRAVTKGLDPNVPLKDSGVEWLREIPVHWEGSRMWRISRAISGGTPTKEEPRYWGGEIPWVSPKDMKHRFIDSSEDTITVQALGETGLKLIPPPAVLIVVRGMILAHSFPVAITRVPVTINQDMKALRLRSDIEPLFIAWVFEGIGKALVAAVVEEAAHGTRAIRMDQWRSVTVPVPPESDQRAIAAFLDRETARIDALVDKVCAAIDRLKELRTALISAAVTGKIDVREEIA